MIPGPSDARRTRRRAMPQVEIWHLPEFARRMCIAPHIHHHPTPLDSLAAEIDAAPRRPLRLARARLGAAPRPPFLLLPTPPPCGVAYVCSTPPGLPRIKPGIKHLSLPLSIISRYKVLSGTKRTNHTSNTFLKKSHRIDF